MKAAVVTEFGGGFHTVDADLAEPARREVRVEVKASGLCHTDLTSATHQILYPVPAVFGHEVAGVVTAVGEDVSGFAPGDHVVGCLVQFCGRCRRCLAGKVYQCLHPDETLRPAGDAPRLTVDGEPVVQAFGLGGFAQQVLVHENQLVRVDEAVPFAQAALLGCGVVTGAGAVLNSAQVQAGDSVVVIGAGGVGLNALNGAVVAGATTIVAVDVSDEKLATARRFGATHVVNSSATDPVEAVREITRGGADAVFDFVGLPAVTRQGFEMAGLGGGLFLIGAHDPRHAFELNTIATIGSQKRVQGVVMGGTTPQRDIPLYAQLYLQGRFELDALVSREIRLDQIDEGYETLKDGKSNRVVITDFS